MVKEELPDMLPSCLSIPRLRVSWSVEDVLVIDAPDVKKRA